MHYDPGKLTSALSDAKTAYGRSYEPLEDHPKPFTTRFDKATGEARIMVNRPEGRMKDAIDRIREKLAEGIAVRISLQHDLFDAPMVIEDNYSSDFAVLGWEEEQSRDEAGILRLRVLDYSPLGRLIRA